MAKKTVTPGFLHVGLVALVLVAAAVVPGNVPLRPKFAQVATSTKPTASQAAPLKAWASLAPAGVALTPLLPVANARVVSVVSGSILQGQNIVVAIQLQSQGDENALGFSITFDTTKLSFVSAVNGSDAAAASLLVNTSQVGLGRVGIGLAFLGDVTFPAGTREIVRLTFATVGAGVTPVGFGDQPLAREVVGAAVNDLTPTTDFTGGTVTINGPAPTLANIAPTNVLAGSGGLTLTVNGANFNGGSIVRWSGSDRPTTFVSATQLTAAITAADLANAGNFSVTVFNPAPGGGESAAAAFAVNNPVPTISTLNPATKTVNEAAFTLTVNGSNFVGSSKVRWNGSDRLTTFVNNTQLTAAITAADVAIAGSFSVTVFNPAPGGGTSSALSFAVNNPVPSISGLSPSSKVVGEGEFTLTVNGTNFVSTSVVNFNGVARVTSFVGVTQLTAVIPASAIASAGTFTVTVTNPAPGGGSSSALSFAVNNPVPSISSLGQSSIIVGGAGFPLTVNGAGFINGSVVRVNGAARTTTFVSATQLTAQILASDIQASGTISITVFNPLPGGGTSGPASLSVENPVPSLSSIAPVSKVAGDPGFPLTVNGANFVVGSVVRWNGSDRLTTFINSGQLTADITTADVANAGTPAVTVFNPAPGGGASGPMLFTVIGPNPVPVISSLSPAQVAEDTAAFNLTLTGTGFIGSSVVQWNGSPRSTTFINATTLTAQITAADITSPGSIPVTVFNPAPGGGTSTAVNFTVTTNPVPVITGLSPNNASAGGAALTITVSGSGFVGSSKVRWNGSDRLTTFVNNTQLTAAITAADVANAGSFSVTVFNPAPGGGTSSALSFAVNNPVPSISGLSPSSKVVGEGEFTLTVNGTNFVSTSVVNFNGVARVTSFVGVTQLTAVIPASAIASAGTFTVTVTNPAPGGGTSPAFSFAVNNPVPSISSLGQSSIIVGAAGFPLTVNGAGFINGSVVRVNGAARTTTFVSATQLTAQILASDIQASGTISITVFNPLPGGGTSGPASLSVENPVPSLSSIAPVSKVAGDPGFPLTVNGANFVVGSVVRWNGSDRLTTFINSGQLTADITTADVANAGTPAVTVFNPAPGGGASGPMLFTVIGPNPVPAISSLSPAQAAEGTAAFNLTLTGTGFISSSVVRWNGSPRATTFINSTQLTAQITAADITSPGSIPVTVFNPAPGGGTSNAVNFTVTNTNPVPAITGLSPNNAVAGGGLLALTVNGTGFISSSVVRWNGSDRPTTFVNNTQLTAAITAADVANAGSFSVTVFNPAPGGGTSSAITFAVNNPVPTISGLLPSSKVVATGEFTLTVNGTSFVSTSVVNFNGVARATSFVGATQLTAVIPASAIASVGNFSVTVFNPAPGGGTSPAFSFAVNNPVPSISSLGQSSIIVGAAGFPLTVNGASFINGSVVQVNGAARTTTFVSATQLTAQILGSDIQATGSISITVFNPLPGGGTSGPASLSVENPVPSLSSIAPVSKVAGDPGFPLTVNGGNFVVGSVVRWNGSDRPTTFINSGQLTAEITTADVANAGTPAVTVFNPAPGGGASSSVLFTVIGPNPVPVISSLSPAQAVQGTAAFTLTLTGTGFISSSVVRWNSSPRATTFINATTLTAQITAADIASSGSIPVTVFNPTPGGGASTAVNFTVTNTNPAPAITGLSPNNAVAGGAALVMTVNGANFVIGSVVRWNGSDRPTTFVNNTQLTAAITAADVANAGSFSVTVFNPAPGGGTSNALSFAVNNPVPSISGLSPSSKVVGEGEFTLTVNGTNFVSTSVVNFNGVARVTSFVGVTQLTAVIPASAIASVGNFSVTVFNPAPGGGTSNAFSFAVNNPVPSISSLGQSSIIVGAAGFPLTVNGASFINGSVVQVNGAARTTTFVSATQLTAQILGSDIQATGSISITVFNPLPGGGTSGPASLSVENPVPSLSSIAPVSKAAGDPGFTLTVNGGNLVVGSVVRWNGSDRPTTFVNSGQLTAEITTADVANAGTPAVTVFNPAPGGGASSSVLFTVIGPNPVPVISSLSPAQAVQGTAAFTLTLTGTGFISSSVVQWNSSPRATTFINATTLTAQITAADIASPGTIPVTVFNPTPGGGASTAVNFTVTNTNPAPAITGLSPNNAVAGGAALMMTVNGANFVIGSVVRWNGSDRPTTFVNNTQLTAAITAADVANAGNFSVTVINPAPGGGTSNAITFAVNNPVPSISSLGQSSIIVGGAGFPLTVNGAGLINGSVVRVNGSARATTYLNASQLTAQILGSDIQATGTILITIFNPLPGGGASGSASLSVENPIPSLSSIAPVSKVAGDPGFTLTVNGGNLVVGSVVRWNGSDRPTTFVNSGQLTAEITTADVANAGTPAVTVFNPAPGGGASGSVPFTVTGTNPGDRVIRVAGDTLNAGQAATIRIELDSLGNENALGFSVTFDPTKLTYISSTPGSGASGATLNVNSFQIASGRVGFVMAQPTGMVFAAGTRQLVVLTFNVAANASGSTVIGFGDQPVFREISDPAVNLLTATYTSATLSITSTSNPVPAITTLSPPSGSAVGPAFDLTVNGINFVNGSMVRWNGSDRPTTFVSATQLTAQISAADVANSGNFLVTVFNPAPGGGTSPAMNFAVNNPMPVITSLSNISAIVGDPGFTLTVNGANFVVGATVQWNGAARPTAFIDATKATAFITAEDLTAAGQFPVTVVNPAPGGGTSASVMFNVNQTAPGKTTQFSAHTMNVNEGGGSLTVTVMRSGDLSGEATVDYRTVDGSATERNDYTTAIGKLRFAPGESQKTITLLITEDSKTEGPESATIVLSNPTGGVVLGNPSVLTFDITDDLVEPPTNANDDSTTFVRQHYHDFFTREADAPGLAFWTNQIESCGANVPCREIKRINVSAAFFLSIEFQETGYLVYKAHQAAFNSGEQLKLQSFLPDTQEIGRGVIIGQPGAELQLETNKQNFFRDFVQRPAFLAPTTYPTTLTAAQFVDKLIGNTFDPLNPGTGSALTPSQRDALVAQLSADPTSPTLRAQVLRSISENGPFTQRQFNKAFVLMQYLGYLRRNPNDAPDGDFGGYNFWLGKLNQFNGNFVSAEMVKAFIVSGEYRQRFGP